MIKLKNILAEGFAWERKEGKGLPTMAEVQAEYAAKQLKENTGNIFDEIADQLGISSESFDDAIDSSRAELDIIENIYMSDSYTSTEALNMIADMLDIDINEAVSQEEADKRWNDPIQMGMRNISKPATSNSTKAPSNFYREKLTALKAQRKQIEFDMEQEAEPQGGPIAEYYGDELQHVDDQIDAIKQKMGTTESIEEVTGEDGRTETISAKRATAELKQKLAGKRSDGMGAYTATIYGVDAAGKKVKLTSLDDIDTTKFDEFGITDKEPRWQDNDGDGNWYEPGVDVKENVNESFVGRLKKNFIGGSIRK
jgi:hypothetical protein